MRSLRLVFLGLAAFVLVALAWRSLAERPGRGPDTVAVRPVAGPVAVSPRPAPGGNRESARFPDATPPEFEPFYAALARAFPRTLEHASAPARDADSALWDAVRDLQQSQGLLAARAPSGDLQAYFDARLAVLDALAGEDARTCADFLYGITDPPFSAFTARHRALVATLAMRELAAIEAGRRGSAARTAPEPADFDQFAAALGARALTSDEIAVLLDGKTLDPPLPDARLCDMGRAYLAALRDLPEAVRHRIYGLAAELLARS